MKLNLRKILTGLISKIQCRISPIRYAIKLGVKVGEGTKFYAPSPDMFSTESWLISLGKNCHIAYGVRFLTHDGGSLVVSNEECDSFVICGKINVGNNVYIGERTTILPGVKIGDNSIIGCGSVVTKDIPSNVIAAGVPCKVIRSREEYIKKIKEIMAGNNPRYFSNLEYMHSLNPNRKILK